MTKYKIVTVNRQTNERVEHFYSDKQRAITEWIFLKGKHKTYKFVSTVIKVK